MPEAHLKTQTLPHKNKALKQQQQQHQQLNVNTNLPKKNYCKSSDQLQLASPKNVQITTKSTNFLNEKSNNNNNIRSPNQIRRVHQPNHYYEEKIPVTSKLKRKLIETISNKVSTANLHKSSVSSRPFILIFSTTGGFSWIKSIILLDLGWLSKKFKVWIFLCR